MISNKTKYGLKAIVYLAKYYGQGQVLITDLAKKEKIPQKFLESILLELRKKGLLLSKKGKGGGYVLGKDPSHIYIGEVLRILEGPIAPVSCVSETAYARCKECKSEEQCEIRVIMKEVRDAMSNVLDKTNLMDLIEKTKKQEGVLNFVI